MASQFRLSDPVTWKGGGEGWGFLSERPRGFSLAVVLLCCPVCLLQACDDPSRPLSSAGERDEASAHSECYTVSSLCIKDWPFLVGRWDG
jgi:hypothetical protein